MKYYILLVVLLAVGRRALSTHVNITISQAHAKNVGLTSESSMQNEAQYRASSSTEVEGPSARLQAGDKDGQTAQYANHRSEGSSIASAVAPDSRMNQRAYFVGQPQMHYRSRYQSSPIEYQRNAQFRKLDEHQKQNMEFERYIQHYHSGPTVETVYESADAMPHLSSARFTDDSQRSGRLVQFERQVALPSSVSETEQQAAQTSGQHQTSPATSVSQQSVSASTSSLPSPSAASSASAPSSPSVSVSTSSGNNLNIKINQRPASVGSDGLNFDQTTSYSKPNYNDANNFKYNNDDSSDSQFFNQYPPSVDEPQGGFGGYFHPNGQDSQFYAGAGYDQPQVGGQSYLPPESINQRPVVTKTIQIAQPAIKTKKYEVRHPAIQKEFYDIEERVLIKPAGTVVVELERPVAKIPKGESILPLGHPHPAVAGAYMNNGNTPAFSNIVYSAAGSSSPSSQANNQYSHDSFYNSKPVHEQRSSPSGSSIASTITSTPNFDQNSKVMAVEASLNKQYNGENQYAPTAAPAKDGSKGRNREVIVITDGQGNQRQISPEQFAYARETAERSHPRSGYNLRSYSNHNQQPQRTNFQSNSPSRDSFNFEAEYVNIGNSGSNPRDSKPARLEQAPVRMEPVIKHDHNIALPPRQHKIYLTQKHAVPESRYVEETAHVKEVKPYLFNHPGPVVVYASSKHRPEVSFRQRGSEYNQPESHGSHYRLSGEGANSAASRVEISAPYAQMRYHHPDEQFSVGHHSRGQYSGFEVDSRKYGKLILENKSVNETKSKMMPQNSKNMSEPQTHIEVNIPPASDASNKVITVSTTMRPMMSDKGEPMNDANLEISISNNGEPRNDENSKENAINDKSGSHEREELANSRDTVDCEKTPQKYMDQRSMRLVEAPSDAREDTNASADSGASSNIQASNIDVTNKGASGHVPLPGHNAHDVAAGSRVIAATPAPRDSSAGSESFHKRRIVVNHPFQTVREVVEHEPYTNYHEVQVNEPASPALYHSAAYFQTHGALRHHDEDFATPIFYH